MYFLKFAIKRLEIFTTVYAKTLFFEILAGLLIIFRGNEKKIH